MAGCLATSRWLSERPKILVVDDEAQITRVLRTTLPIHGYEVQVANDGEAALALFNAWRPDLVITDLVMPNMSGIELCENIRDRSQVPAVDAVELPNHVGSLRRQLGLRLE